MTRKLKKSYSFALKSSSFICLISSGLLIIFSFFTEISWQTILLFVLLLFVCSFFVLQYRIERFIYRGIQKIYSEVSLLESSSYQPITTDVSTLRQEITRFARDKKNEIDDLKNREDYRKEFIGNVSHELNTPLFTVQGYILTLLDGAMEDKTIRKKYLQRAAKGVERLIYIVKDLDMIAKLEAGMLHLELSVFNVVEVIESAFDLYEIQAKKRNITLTFDKRYQPVWVYADRERIQQVIANIIMNSINYGRENGTTEVAIETLNDQKILIQITDNGEGVAQENLHRLFERFYRVDKSRSRKQGGSGLGLSIVKHIIEAHEEKLYVESTLGVGSEFSFTLQKRPSAQK